jgi:hypothetical protein
MPLDICSCHFAHLQWIITGEETWVHHYPPETKQESIQWKHLLSAVAKKFTTQPLAGKLMLTILWDSQEPVLETYLEHGTAVTSAVYCDILQRGLKPAVCPKRRGRLSEDILLLHDNARPHTVACMLETLGKSRFCIIWFSHFWTA